MFYIYDTKNKKSVTRPMQLRCNAQRTCQVLNIKYEGVDETEKPENDRRFVIRGC